MARAGRVPDDEGVTQVVDLSDPSVYLSVPEHDLTRKIAIEIQKRSNRVLYLRFDDRGNPLDLVANLVEIRFHPFFVVRTHRGALLSRR
jgi:hypothetical protein